MLRKFFILIILILIISTTFIKNHTKKIDEKIFFTKENIIYLNSILGLVQLEYNYLSSPENILEYEAAGWTNVALAILNLSEVITRN